MKQKNIYNDVINLYNKHMNQREISNLLNIPYSTVGFILKKNNILLPNEKIKNIIKNLSDDELLMTETSICKKYNLCRKTYHKYFPIERYNIIIKDIIDMYNNNYKIDEIRKKYNIPKTNFYSILKANNIEKRKNIEDIKEKNIIDELKNPIFITEIMKKYHISPNSIKKIANQNDIIINQIGGSSIMEREVRNYISKYFNIICNKKTIIGQEIDIYIPEKKIGIEFNGNYWHSENQKCKKFHQNKSLLAETKDIFIYHIFEYEWETKREQIINQLNNLLGINQEKIYARKCIIKNVNDTDKKLFLELNHLQGNDTSSIKLGLYYNNELVSIMTFVKPRFNKNYQYELSRFCSKAGCNVIGGASKLFKSFMNQYNPSSVISYSNIAHTRGKLYEKLGFKLDKISSPNYVWCKNKDVKSRYQCQKHKLLEQGYTGNSEVDIMHKLGYYRIFDCGNKVWIFEKL